MILVADNLQVTNPIIATAIDQLNPEPIQDLVKKCESAGAQAIDINPGPLSKIPEKKMTFRVEAVLSVTRLPLLLDTSNPKALEAGKPIHECVKTDLVETIHCLLLGL